MQASSVAKLLLSGVPLLLLAACGGGGAEQPQRPTPTVGVVTLKTESVPLVADLAGRTAAFETSDVRPQVSGVIKARLFTEGTIVKQGQTLYQIDPSLYEAQVAQAKADVASARAARQSAQALANRYKPLVAMEAVSRQEYENAVSSAQQASAAVQQAQAALETAQINLRFTKVPAPITGRVGRSFVTTGALVTANQTDPMTSIQRLDPIFVDVKQSSSEILALRRALAGNTGLVPASTQVRLKLEDGSDYGMTGTLEFAESVVDPNTGAVTLRARFPNPQGLLLPGMYVTAQVTRARQENAILVPQSGVARDPKGNATALVVGPDNKVVQRDVTTTRAVGNKWLVTKGLKPGDKLIIQGTGNIRPGQAVKAVPADTKVQFGAPKGGQQGAGGGENGAGEGKAGAGAQQGGAQQPQAQR